MALIGYRTVRFGNVGHTHRAPSFLAVLQVEREDLRMSYLGSKGGSGVYQKIIAEMPPHDTYIETHLGSGAVMFQAASMQDDWN
jgi:hypothetical protein